MTDLNQLFSVTISYGHDKERVVYINENGKRVLEAAFVSNNSVKIIFKSGKEVIVNMDFVQEIEFNNLFAITVYDANEIVENIVV